MANLHRLLLLLAVIFLSSCTAPRVIGNTPVTLPTVPVSLLTATPVPTAASTVTPTRMIPSLTPVLSSTPVTELAWGSGIDKWKVEGIENRYVDNIQWSPTANEFVYLLPRDDQLDIMLAKEPDFIPQSLASVKYSSEGTFLPGVTWSPDGNSILFWGPNGSRRNDVWIVRRDGTDLHSLNVEDSLLNPIFSYWLDDHTVLYENYSGGGHVQVTALNSQTGEFEQIAMAHGLVSPPKDGYIPVLYSFNLDDYHLFLISRKFPSRGEEEGSYLMSGRFVSFSAIDDSPNTDTMTSFQGWQPGTYNALVSWSKYSSYPSGHIQKQSLLLWDISNGSTSVIAPDAFHGEFSSDGRFMAYQIFDPNNLLAGDSAFYDTGSGILMYLDPTTEDWRVLDDQIYLQLMTMPDRNVLLSIPGRSSSFSPDGRYLTFISNGQIRTNAQNWPVALREEAEQKLYLHLVDLQTTRLSASLPDVASFLGWSPDNRNFLYQDASGSVLLYQIGAKITVPVLTRLDGREIEQVKWSHDGAYLILAAGKPGDTEDLVVAVVNLP